MGKPQVQTHDFVFVNNRFRTMGSSALIMGDGWKLIEIDRKQDQFQLYNIKNDNDERHNLAKEYPEKVSNLKTIFAREIDSERPDLK